MKEFSLYDFLGLLLPGILFLFFCSYILKQFGLYSPTIAFNAEVANYTIALCFAIISGALLYVLNFYLVKKKWYNTIFGMYKPVTELYMQLEFLHQIMNSTLNKKAIEWYGVDIFLDKHEFYNKPKEDQKKIEVLQDEYYDRMYYKMEYLEKNMSAKTFQSFYFFFRQTVLAVLILLLSIGVLYGLSSISCLNITISHVKIIPLTSLLFSLLVTNTMLACWFRKRMVMKMYWGFYNYLDSNSKNGGQSNG